MIAAIFDALFAALFAAVLAAVMAAEPARASGYPVPMIEQAPWPLHVFRHCPHCGAKTGAAVSIKQFVCQECSFQFFSNAAAAVMAIITNEQGEVLFTRRARAPAKGMLDLPGGFVDPLESAEAALHREIREELNLELSNARFLCSFPNRYDYAGVTYYTTDLVFLCTATDPEGLTASEEVTEVRFLRPADLRQEEIGLASAWEAIQAYLRLQERSAAG